MQKTYTNCGESNTEHARFCGKCDTTLHDSKSPGYGANERTPADQAAKIVEQTKVKTDKLKVKIKNLWENFVMGEKIMASGAAAMLLSFFLPWFSVFDQSVNGLALGEDVWYVYLMPLSAAASLVLLYFSQGAAKEKKISVASWQIVIGTVWSSISFLAVFAVNSIINAIQSAMGGFGALLGRSAGIDDVSVGIGLYLLVAGSAAVVVGAFKLQQELLFPAEESKKGRDD
ncbi:MAG: hypothetical protein DDT32_02071 [Syntrophomonadaceae bacterium]|nr:hypothetical protein [Bacillota bacterium]